MCDALNDMTCTRCHTVHAPADVPAATSLVRASKGLAEIKSKDCRELQGHETLPRPRGGPILSECIRKEDPQLLAEFDRVNVRLAVAGEDSGTGGNEHVDGPLAEAPLVKGNRLLVLAKLTGYSAWPATIARVTTRTRSTHGSRFWAAAAHQS